MLTRRNWLGAICGTVAAMGLPSLKALPNIPTCDSVYYYREYRIVGGRGIDVWVMHLTLSDGQKIKYETSSNLATWKAPIFASKTKGEIVDLLRSGEMNA